MLIPKDQAMSSRESDTYKAIPQQPELNKPYLVDGQYWMQSIYYGDSMMPGLIPGDRMILRERPMRSTFNGEICLLQLGDVSNAFMCRINESTKRDHVSIKGDNPRFKEQDVPLKNVVGIWEIISSHRAHTFSYSTVNIPGSTLET
jgi:hypothetical protein